jgi:NTP pyrophosphatase (non-canonical NTP hydrolase)
MNLDRRIGDFLAVNEQLFPRILNHSDVNALFAQLLGEAGEAYGAAHTYLGREYDPSKTRDDLGHVKEELGDLLGVVLALFVVFRIHPSDALLECQHKLEALLKAKQERELL